MSTLADELLQDFEDSGSENGDERHDVDPGADDDTGLEPDGLFDRHQHQNHHGADTDMVLDGDEEEEADEEDEVMGGTNAALALDTTQDEAAAKAQVEKMQLGSVKDIRKVTRLMDRLEPLLKVSSSLLYNVKSTSIYISALEQIDLTHRSPPCRISPTTNPSLSTPRPST